MSFLKQIPPGAVDHGVAADVAASLQLNLFEATSAESHTDLDGNSISSSAHEHRAETWPHKQLALSVGTAEIQGSGCTNMAEQLDNLGDTMLAELEAAWAAEGKGDGLHGAPRLGADAFGVHELLELPNLDTLSERCSLVSSEGFKKHDEQGSGDSRYSCVESILRRRSELESEIDEDGCVLAINRPVRNVMWVVSTARRHEERHAFGGVDEVWVPTVTGGRGISPEDGSIGSRVGNASAKHMENVGGELEAASCVDACQAFPKSYDLDLNTKGGVERGFGTAIMQPSPNASQPGGKVQVQMAPLEFKLQPQNEHGGMQQVGTREGSAEPTGGCFERSPTRTGNVNRARGPRFQLLSSARSSSTPACTTPPFPCTAFCLQSSKCPSLGGGSTQGPVDASKSYVWGQQPRMHLSPQQRKVLQGFGTDVSWVGPGIERMEEAHQICKSMSIGMRQLKKWICNHRPKRFRRSPTAEVGVPLPRVMLPPTAESAAPENHGGATQRNADPKQSAFEGAELDPGEGHLGTTLAEAGRGGEQVLVDAAHFATARNLRQNMGRKMKDFDPGEVQTLVEICKSYRQRHRMEASLHEPSNGPPKKKRLMSLLADNDQLPRPPSLVLKGASQPNNQGRDSLLANSTLFCGRSDPLAVDSNGRDGGDLTQPALSFVHSLTRVDSAQPFDHSSLEGQFGAETRLPPPPLSPTPFVSWSGVADLNSQLRTEPDAHVGLGSGPSCNPASHPAALYIQTLLEMGPLCDVARPSRNERIENDGLARSGGGLVSQQPMRGSYLFEKVLTVSDTSSLRRIMLPKKEAELHLPKLSLKEGGLITIEDADRNQWQLRYRFWPNHRSRIYVFEDTGGFVHSRGLRPGDYLVVCRAKEGHLILNDRRRSRFPEEDLNYCCAETEG